MLEKVAFDSHSLTEGHHHHHKHSDNEKLEPFINKGLSNSHEEDVYEHLEHNDIENHDQHRQGEGDYKLLNNLKKNEKHSSFDKTNRLRTNTYNAKKVNLSPPHECQPINVIIDEPKEADANLDIDEDTIKNIVSTKGKFASYLQNRNIRNIILI